MDNEQLTAKVKDLEHFLSEVWDWEDLHHIGWEINDLWNFRDQGDPDHLQIERDLNTKLELHLSTRYGLAVGEMDQVLPQLPRGEVLDALLERLRRRMQDLGDPDNSFRHFLDRVQQPDVGAFENETGTRPQAETERDYKEHVDRTRNAWACVSGDLSEYLGRVAYRVVQHRFGKVNTYSQEASEVTSQDRIIWNDTAGRLALLFETLRDRKYITLPQYGGADNYAAMGRMLHAVFDVRKKDEPVGAKTLEQAMKPSAHKTKGKDPFACILDRSLAQ